MRIRFLIIVFAGSAFMSTAAWPAQDSSDKQTSNAPAASQPAPSSQSAPNKASTSSAPISPDDEPSSSLDTRIDISPPKDDDKSHPSSKDAVKGLEASDSDSDNGNANAGADPTGVQEFHPWSPLKAIKDIEVGDFYFKRRNYKAALERYKEALTYKEGDAVATYRIAESQQKLGNKAEAKKYYEQYLKILPEGPYAEDAHASLDKLAKER